MQSSAGGAPPTSQIDTVTAEGLFPYRTVGDRLADETIAAIFGAGEDGLQDVRSLLLHCVKNDHPLRETQHGVDALPPSIFEKVQAYFEESDRSLTEFDQRKIRVGERVFQEHGPEVLMLLATYSLPASYTARRGVQVLAQTGRLESQPVRRLIETTQMVIDVMAPGGLTIGKSALYHGKGIRTAQKVRLMHAAIRRLLLERYGEKWVQDYGVPINQMDLCGTLMTFSAVILDGLSMLRVELTSEEQDAYLYAWRAVGSIMGIDPVLIPHTVEGAHELTSVIREAEIGRCPQGVELTSALVGAYQGLIEPKWLRGLPVALMRRFLGAYADVLEIPRAGFTSILVTILIFVSGALDTVLRRSRLLRRLHRKFAMLMVRVFLRIERGGNRPTFEIPDTLADGWRLGRS